MLDHLPFFVHITHNGLIGLLHVLDARQHARAVTERSDDVFKASPRGLLESVFEQKSGRETEIAYFRIEEI